MTNTADDIAASCRAEAKRLRERADLLHSVALVLEGELKPDVQLHAVPDDAPYGYKADGVTPRKRRAPADPTYAKRAWETRRAAAAAAGQSESVSMRVLSSTHPTERELEGREVAHTTEAPAA